MYKILIIAGVMLLTACSAGSPQTLQENELSPAEIDEGWDLLFNGSNLDGWTLNTPGTWESKDGCIVLGKEMGMGSRGMIWTREEYDNFLLECEFKIEPECNSGIFFRVGDIESPVQTGFEMQIVDSFANPVTGPQATHSCGAFYDIVAPSHNMAKPAGEWNHARITCLNNVISISLNGDQVVSTVDLDLYTEPNQNIDGTANKFNLPLRDFPRSGRIGFQQHGGKVWFRNIKIKEL